MPQERPNKWQKTKKKKKKMTRQTLGGLTQWVITVQEKDGAQLQIQGRKIETYSLG